jgi:hypothetical protein
MFAIPAPLTYTAGKPCRAITRANKAFAVPGRIAAERDARMVLRRVHGFIGRSAA